MYTKHIGSIVSIILAFVVISLSKEAVGITYDTDQTFSTAQDWNVELMVISGATVTFQENAHAESVKVFGANIILSSGKNINVDGDFNINGDAPNNASFTFASGCVVTAGDSISFQTEFAQGNATVSVQLNSGTATLQSNSTIHTTRNATLTIGAGATLNANSKIFILGKYEHAMPGDVGWFPQIAPLNNELSGGTLVIGSNAILNISDIGYFGEGSTTNAGTGSSIEIGGALYILAGTHDFKDIKAGYSTDPVPYKGAKIYGGTINFNGNVDINGSSLFQGLMGVTLGTSSGYETNGDFELMGSSSGSNQGKATLRMSDATHIEANGVDSGIIISSGGGTAESELIILANNDFSLTTPKYANLLGDYILVTESGKITVESDSTLKINVDPLSTLFVPSFIIGKYDPDVMDFTTPLDYLPSGRGQSTGGTLSVASGSTVDVGSTMYVGEGAVIDMATNSTISIGGALYITGGTMHFGNIDVGWSATPTPYGGFCVYGGTVYFDNSASIMGNFTTDGGTINVNGGLSATRYMNIERNSNITLASGKVLGAGISIEMEGYGSEYPTLTMNSGSTINAGVSTHGGLNIGLTNGYVDKSKVIISANASLPAVINVGQYLHIVGELNVQDNSTLTINIADTSGSPTGQGIALVGWYRGDFNNLIDPETSQPYPDENPSNNLHATGLLKIGNGSDVNVNGRFLLSDSGTLDISPTGSMNVNGDFYWKKNGVYNVGVNSSDVSFINVTGQAHIENGAIVKLSSNLLSAVGERIFLAGSYEDTTLPVSPFNKISRDGNYLIIDSVSSQNTVNVISATGGHGVSENYANASALIDHIIVSDSASPELLDSLNNFFTTAYELAEDGNPAADIAFKQIIGEEAVASVNVAADTISNINVTLGNRFNIIHTNHFYAPSAGSLDNLNRLWVAGFGSFVRQKNIDGMYGYDYNVGGLVIGYDREIEAVPGLTLGLNFSWASGKAKNNDGLSDIKVKTIGIGAYGSYEFPNSLYLDASIGFGFSDNDFTSEQILGGRKTADFDSNSFQATLELGYNHALTDNLYLTPSVGLNYVHIKQNGWSERIDYNPYNLVIANWFSESKVDYLEVPVGLKLQGDIQTAGGVMVSPDFHVGGVFVVDKPNRDLRFGFVGSNDSTTIRGIDSGKHRLVVGAGLKVQVTDSLDLFSYYDLETRKSYVSHNAQVGAGISF
jgi:outer membrane autotransporter protein